MTQTLQNTDANNINPSAKGDDVATCYEIVDGMSGGKRSQVSSFGGLRL